MGLDHGIKKSGESSTPSSCRNCWLREACPSRWSEDATQQHSVKQSACCCDKQLAAVFLLRPSQTSAETITLEAVDGSQVLHQKHLLRANLFSLTWHWPFMSPANYAILWWHLMQHAVTKNVKPREETIRKKEFVNIFMPHRNQLIDSSLVLPN